jgi:hypothetical protein
MTRDPLTRNTVSLGQTHYIACSLLAPPTVASYIGGTPTLTP